MTDRSLERADTDGDRSSLGCSGFEWVVPEPVKEDTSWKPGRLHEPSVRRWGRAADAFESRQEAQRRLIAMQRELDKHRGERARVEHLERKEALGRQVRQEHEQLTGRTAHAKLVAKASAQVRTRVSGASPARGDGKR